MTIRDPKAKLKAALDILDQFTNEQNPGQMPNHVELRLKGLGIRRIVEFAQGLIVNSFSKKSQKMPSDGVKRAIDDVKRYHPIIHQSGSQEHQKLSQRALESINRYNQLLDSADERKKTWYEKLFYFFTRKDESALNKKSAIYISQETEQCEPALRAASAIQNALLKQEEDAFRMKAISLIKKRGIVFPSIESALQSIRETPIYISGAMEQETASVVTLNQTLTPFPGETIILSGAFRRSPGGLMPTIPISNSFELATSNNHTGHPFPSQHNGWTLPDPLIPSIALKADEVPLLEELLSKKKMIKEALHDQKPLKKHALTLINLKKEAAESQLEPFIKLHINLCCALVSAAPPYLIQTDTTPVILNFFEWIKQQPSPYESLSRYWREFNNRYLWFPYKALYQSWIKQTDPDLFSNDQSVALSTAKQILNAAVPTELEPLPSEVEHFFSCMRGMISIPCRNIFLQYFSELIEFEPPVLNDFEKTLQSLAFTQLQDYISEIESDLPARPFEKIQRSLTYETELLGKQGQYHLLVGKLENYYAKRMAQEFST